jgi:hypothetical protein
MSAYTKVRQRHHPCGCCSAWSLTYVLCFGHALCEVLICLSRCTPKAWTVSETSRSRIATTYRASEYTPIIPIYNRLYVLGGRGSDLHVNAC